MFAFGLLTFAFAATASVSVAFPAVKRAASGPWCNNLGIGAFDNQKNFTLTAYNTTLPNANTTGAPLVLGQAGAITGEELKVLSVRMQHVERST